MTDMNDPFLNADMQSNAKPSPLFMKFEDIGKDSYPKLSDSAVKQIHKLASREERGGAMLRLKVLGGGCSGFQYKFDIAFDLQEKDILIERDGAKLVTDEASIPFLIDVQLDYIDELGGAYFKVNNPQAKSACGCGTSFSV